MLLLGSPGPLTLGLPSVNALTLLLALGLYGSPTPVKPISSPSVEGLCSLPVISHVKLTITFWYLTLLKVVPLHSKMFLCQKVFQLNLNWKLYFSCKW